MSYRKIVIAVDCSNEAEVLRVQAAAKRMSEIFRFRADDILQLAPIVEKNGTLIANAIRTITQEGMRGVVRMVPYLIKNLKK